MTTPHPAHAALVAIAREYPDCWRELDFLIATGRSTPSLAGWPAWCWVPMAASYAVVSRGETLSPGDPRIVDVGRLAALAAWRPTQGIYRVDEALLDALWTSGVDGSLPVETLLHLPEWCVYVETPGRHFLGTPIYGFWAHLEYSVERQAAADQIELRFVVHSAVPLSPGASAIQALFPVPLHLGGGTLDGAARAAFETARSQNGAAAVPEPLLQGAFSLATQGVEPLLSALLYICSTAEELRAQDGRAPRHPRPTPGRKGQVARHYPPDAPAIYEAGVRLGAALRSAQARGDERSAQEGAGGVRAILPHVRRAHWHTYLLGPRDQPRRRVVRWQHPIFVGEQAEDALPTIHLVEDVKS